MGINRLLDSKFVRNIEKYLQLDLRYYIRNYFYLIVAEAITMALGMPRSRPV